MLDYKAADTHSEYVILIAFPRQQLLHERASILLYVYIAYLVSDYLIYVALYLCILLSEII
jgi:hypothetical protein